LIANRQVFRPHPGLRPSHYRGGQNQARAILTGALVGAQVGLFWVPQRFLDRLETATVLGRLTADLAVNLEAE